MTRRQLCSLLALLSTVPCGACRDSSAQASTPAGVTLAALTVTSPAFPTGGPIPVDFTCDGADQSPPLTWSAPPPDTRAIAIVANDPDAPGGDFTHWLAFNLSPSTTHLGPGQDPSSVGGVVGTNSFHKLGYSGPCPPRHERHHYRFRVLALISPVTLEPGATRSAVEGALHGRVIGEGTLVGTFEH